LVQGGQNHRDNWASEKEKGPYGEYQHGLYLWMGGSETRAAIENHEEDFYCNGASCTESNESDEEALDFRPNLCNIKAATTEDEKASITAAFSDHLTQAQAERQYYLDCCSASASTSAHYTFLILPNGCPCHIKVGRKVQLFGICCDTTKIQHNCLVDESETIGKDVTKCRAPNAVI
jgi:hypothetical protein